MATTIKQRHEFSEEETAWMREEFEKYNRSGNGITSRDLGTLMRTIRRGPPPSDLEFVKEMGQYFERNEWMDFDTLLEILERMFYEGPDRGDVVFFIQQLFDKDQTGLVTAPQLRQVISKLSVWSEEQVDTVIQEELAIAKSKAENGGDEPKIDYQDFARRRVED